MSSPFLNSFELTDTFPFVSDDYAQVILRNQMSYADTSRYSFLPVDSQYSILYLPVADWTASLDLLSYHSIPKLFAPLNTVSLEASGILSSQLQPYLNLQGEGILVGFLDSGIDYTHPAFRNPDGSTRILRIWDQTIQTDQASGSPPQRFPFGTEYTEDQINNALRSSSPYEIVPSRDENGHGTAIAGIACGSTDETSDFTGVAPKSSLLFVKLRPARNYLRDYFRIPEGSVAWQETDLMLGVQYLTETALALQKPLVICMSSGTNQGGHTGHTPLEDVLNSVLFYPGIYAVAAAGNEAGRGHHYEGRSALLDIPQEIELLVDRETRGFTVEFWTNSPELYSVGFTSPLGETIQPIQPRSGVSVKLSFLLETSKIDLSYYIVETLTGDQMIQMRFQNPSVGIWRIRVVNRSYIDGIFHMWLPVTGLVDPEVRFYNPNVDTTIVIPACAYSLITCSTYNAYNNSIYINSSRGYTRDQMQKPDFASPGVDITAPFPGGTYGSLTGSCAAAALTAGASALVVESGLKRELPLYFTPAELKSLFLHGADRSRIYSYPNREWGYGTMDVYGIFESFL